MRRTISTIIDFGLAPLTFCAALYFRITRRRAIGGRPASSAIFRLLGVLPISDHYYEPLFIKPKTPITRSLPGIDLNEKAQLELLERLTYANEIADLEFDFSNGMYAGGDADFLYQMVRHLKPKRVVEIGAGKSTEIFQLANAKENDQCEHTCIEPYEAPWLDNMPVRLIREKVENVNPTVFTNLEAGDILFIDSSHIIRPGGDVLYEFLSLLPTLAPAVLVHIHDIFTPFDYPDDWLWRDMRLWNEQYLLEAFLSHNSDFEVVAALSWLKQTHHNLLLAKCPMMSANRIPGAFWIRRK